MATINIHNIYIYLVEEALLENKYLLMIPQVIDKYLKAET